MKNKPSERSKKKKSNNIKHYSLKGPLEIDNGLIKGMRIYTYTMQFNKQTD